MRRYMISSTYNPLQLQMYAINKATTNKRQNRNTAYRIQYYNNQQIDDLILHQDDNTYQRPSDSLLWADLYILNKPEVYRNYNRLMNSPYIRDDMIQKMLIRNRAEKTLNNIVEKELERLNHNLDYVEQVIRKYEVPRNEYRRLRNEQEERSILNRRKFIEGIVRANNTITSSTGLNIPQPYSYRNLDTVAENLLREQRMTSQHETAIETNQRYMEEHGEPLYTRKVWVWTGAGKTTRHESNNMQTVGINDTFVILNDIDGTIDRIDYPMDPSGSFSNCALCYCDVIYENEDVKAPLP